jgi:hypothetical protein
VYPWRWSGTWPKHVGFNVILLLTFLIVIVHLVGSWFSIYTRCTVKTILYNVNFLFIRFKYLSTFRSSFFLLTSQSIYNFTAIWLCLYFLYIWNEVEVRAIYKSIKFLSDSKYIPVLTFSFTKSRRHIKVYLA